MTGIIRATEIIKVIRVKGIISVTEIIRVTGTISVAEIINVITTTTGTITETVKGTIIVKKMEIRKMEIVIVHTVHVVNRERKELKKLVNVVHSVEILKVNVRVENVLKIVVKIAMKIVESLVEIAATTSKDHSIEVKTTEIVHIVNLTMDKLLLLLNHELKQMITDRHKIFYQFC